MPTFQAVSDDEQRMSTYILQRCPPELKADLDSYMCYRTATFASKRQGGAVQVISHKTLYRVLTHTSLTFVTGAHLSAPMPPRSPSRPRLIKLRCCASLATSRRQEETRRAPRPA